MIVAGRVSVPLHDIGSFVPTVGIERICYSLRTSEDNLIPSTKPVGPDNPYLCPISDEKCPWGLDNECPVYGAAIRWVIDPDDSWCFK